MSSEVAGSESIIATEVMHGTFTRSACPHQEDALAETLHNGYRVEIRTFGQTDRAELLVSVGRTSRRHLSFLGFLIAISSSVVAQMKSSK